MEKICRDCQVEKDINEFGKRPDSLDGHRNDCKECRSNYMKMYKEKNLESLSEKRKKYNQDNKEVIKEKSLKWRENNKDKITEKNKKYNRENKEKVSQRNKEYRENNKEKVAEQKRRYYENNREKENRRKNEWVRERKKTDMFFKLRLNIRTLIGSSIRNAGFRKSQLRLKKTEIILGCKIEDFIKYIESKFLEGMNWGNRGEWHIDHIRPASLAKTEEEIIELNHYTNLQPLWAVDNFKKGNRFIG
jgi:hypothetical protein